MTGRSVGIAAFVGIVMGIMCVIIGTSTLVSAIICSLTTLAVVTVTRP
jgi:hypothetical protein